VSNFEPSALIDDMETLFPERIPPDQIKAIHKSSVEGVDRLVSTDVRFFIIGSYDEPQKSRLQTVRRLLSIPDRDEAFTLEEIDPEVDVWENFYVKFRIFRMRADYVIGVFEDNDGGHELEVGDADLSKTYVLKRDYRSISVDDDVEYEKYDAMLGTLFDLLDRRKQLITWETKRELLEGAAILSAELGHGSRP
jgi:hypothetical protein